MAIGDVIARLAVSLTLETAAFEKGATIAEKRMAQSQRTFESLGKRFTNLGKTLSLSVTAPLVAFGIASVKAAKESAEAMGQVNAALEHMGNGAGRTSEQLQGLARNLMHQSLYDDDEILRKVTANLLTFGTVAGENFDRAQKAAVDLAARMGTDLQSATIMIGKALNDPAKGLAALRRVGIQFTQEQQTQIKTMAEAGNQAGAQAVMLRELERQFGGSAKAMRDANPAAAFKNAMDDLQEQVGGKLLPLIPKVTQALMTVIDAFDQLSPKMQNFVIIGGGLAAALGPTLIGIGGLIKLLAPLGAGLVTLFGVIAEAVPVGATFGTTLSVWAAGLSAALVPLLPFIAAAAALAAAGYAIYENWAEVQPILQGVWDTIKSTIGPPFMELVAAVKTALSELWSGPFGDAMRIAGPFLLEFGKVVASVLGATLIGVVETAAVVIGLAFKAIAAAVRLVTALFDGTFKNIIVSAVSAVYQGIKTWLQDKLDPIWKWVTDKVKMVRDAFHWLWDELVGHSIVPDTVDGIAEQMARLDAVLVQPVTKATTKATKAFRTMSQETRNLLDRLFPEIDKAAQFQKDLKTLQGLHLAPGTETEAVQRLWSQFLGNPSNDNPTIDFGDTDLIKGTVNVGNAIEALAKKSEIQTVRITKTFKDMAQETMSSLSNLANAIKGGSFLDILGSVINLGLQLGSIGVFGKKIQTNINNAPKFATGTMHHYGGMALVGERGPELVDLPTGSRVYPNGRTGGAVNFDLRGAVMTVDLLKQMQGMAANSGGIATMAGAKLGEQNVARRQRRRIPG